jgi:hypothetical protein
MEGLKKATERISQDPLCPGRDLNRASPEYKSRALPLYQSDWYKTDSGQQTAIPHQTTV